MVTQSCHGATLLMGGWAHLAVRSYGSRHVPNELDMKYYLCQCMTTLEHDTELTSTSHTKG